MPFRNPVPDPSNLPLPSTSESFASLYSPWSLPGSLTLSHLFETYSILEPFSTVTTSSPFRFYQDWAAFLLHCLLVSIRRDPLRRVSLSPHLPSPQPRAHTSPLTLCPASFPICHPLLPDINIYLLIDCHSPNAQLRPGTPSACVDCFSVLRTRAGCLTP